MGLEEAQLADAFGGDAAGGEVGDAAGFELDADVGDVYFGGEDGEADGANFAERGAGHEEDDVEVVDHEVEDDVYVERARGEDAEPVAFKKHGAGEEGKHGGDGRIEALEVTDLKDAMVLLRRERAGRRLVERGGEGLFDEDVEAGLKQFGDDRGVLRGWERRRRRRRGNGSGGEGGEEQVNGREEGGVVPGGDSGARPVGWKNCVSTTAASWVWPERANSS